MVLRRLRRRENFKLKENIFVRRDCKRKRWKYPSVYEERH